MAICKVQFEKLHCKDSSRIFFTILDPVDKILIMLAISQKLFLASSAQARGKLTGTNQTWITLRTHVLYLNNVEKNLIELKKLTVPYYMYCNCYSTFLFGIDRKWSYELKLSIPNFLEQRATLQMSLQRCFFIYFWRLCSQCVISCHCQLSHSLVAHLLG